MDKDKSEQAIREKFLKMKMVLNERAKRLWAATEAKSLGRGGAAIVSRAIGVHVVTVHKGLRELNEEVKIKDKSRSRIKGGGRKSLLSKTTIQEDLKNLVEQTTRGDPESPLLWTCKSTYNLESELNNMGHKVSQRSICTYLKDMGYSLQANKKTEEGGSHPDRNEQFENIYTKSKEFIESNDPVISVDTKKKENIGNYKNSGQEYYKKGEAPNVNVYDFVDKEKGKVSPYGIYDLSRNNGWVSVGISSDTAEFAVNSIRSWWEEMGVHSYGKSKRIYINCDGGGTNGSRNRLWKVRLQTLANELGLSIHVSHFPPGTSKWNKIEHKMFSFISKNWRGKPLIDRATVVNLISSTKTKKGLEISARIDEREYKKGIKISDAELLSLNIIKNKFHGEWNYEIRPKT
jgi:transposase